MFDLEIVSALEVEIVVKHVCSDLDETGAQKGEQEGSQAEDMGDLKCDYSTENYWDKGRLQERDAHGLSHNGREGGVRTVAVEIVVNTDFLILAKTNRPKRILLPYRIK